MGGYSPRYPRYFPMPPVPDKPDPEPSEDEKSLLATYHVLRMEISSLEERITDEKELDKAAVLLKVGCKLIKKRLRKIGFKGPLRIRAALKAPGDAGGAQEVTDAA